MTGDGSDELFVAYPQHIQAALAESLKFVPSLRRFWQIKQIQQAMLPEGYNNTALGWEYMFMDKWKSFLSMLSMFSKTYSPAGGESIVGSDLLSISTAPVHYANFSQDSTRLPRERILAKRLYFDFHYGILPRILHIKDMISMAHGVEIRSPFMA